MTTSASATQASVTSAVPASTTVQLRATSAAAAATETLSTTAPETRVPAPAGRASRNPCEDQGFTVGAESVCWFRNAASINADTAGSAAVMPPVEITGTRRAVTTTIGSP